MDTVLRSTATTLALIVLGAFTAHAGQTTPGLEAGKHPTTPSHAVSGRTVGGPDTFGYEFIDSDEPNGPTFQWLDISGTGTPVTLSDDSHFFPVALPFTFSFYGVDRNELAIGSNGVVYFENAYLGLANTPIPGTAGYAVQTFIAGYWDDLNPTPGTGGVYYEIVGDAPDRQAIIQFERVWHFGGSDENAVTFQVVLYESSNDIRVQYLNPSPEAGIGAGVGIQGDPSEGLQYSNDVAALTAELAICFTAPDTSNLCGEAQEAPYRFLDSNQDGGPTFQWVDISGTGTELMLADDDYFFPVALPFTFTFYGQDHNQLAVGSNGVVYFEDDYLGLSNTPIPGPTDYNVQTFIAGYWDDLNPEQGSGRIFHEIVGEAPERRAIVQFDAVEPYGGTAEDAITFQIIVYEGSNDIRVQYLDPSPAAGVEAGVGIQGSETAGLQYSNDEAVLAPKLAICFMPEASPGVCGESDVIFRDGFEEP